MRYDSLDQIYEEKERVLASLAGTVLALSAAQQNFRPSAGRWTIAEIVEHLSIVETRLLKLVTALIRKAEAGRPLPSSHDEFRIIIPDGAEDAKHQKIRARPEYEPSGKLPVAESLRMMQAIHLDLNELRPRLEEVVRSTVTFQHWVFGPLTLGQWFTFIGVHEQRHLAQILAVMTSPGFPGAQTEM